jgi:hypothetical protein
VHEYETARLKSTAGAGVGSVLLTESVVLNPASLSVFNVSAITYQRDNNELLDRNAARATQPNSFGSKTHNNALIVAEGSNKVKGAVGYFDQVEGSDKRKRITTSLGGSVTEKSSFGINYKYTKETTPTENAGAGFDYHSFSLGMMHFVSPQLSIGALLDDPTKSKARLTKAAIGLQYVAFDFATVMADIGSDYNKSVADNRFYRTAVQFKIISDFYVRGGLFSDKKNQEKGTGWGAGWVGPKLALEFGMKFTKPIGNPSYSLLTGERYREMGISLAYQF